uniref:ATP-binding cassette sub-family B member 10, mitochondrial n=1 Tax=Cuerna arida TaxID=1464854 RepID=A0A1B6FPA5_9HEMI
MILVNRLWFVCRTNKYPMKVLWSAGKGERVILDNSRIYSVLLCKQCVQNFSKSVSVQSGKHLPFSRVFPGYVRCVLQCIRRPKSTNANSALLKNSGNKSEKLEASKISKQEFKRLLGLAKPERWKLAGAIALLLVSSTVTMAIPFALGKVIDIIYTEDSKQMRSNLNALCATLLGVFILGGLCNFGRVYLMNLSGQRITRALRERVFGSIMKQEVAYFDQNRTGELINRLSTDTSVVSQCVTMNISDGLRSTIMVCAGVSMMFYMSPELALVGLAIVPPVAGMAIVYGRFVRNITKRVQDSLAEATQVAEERIGNIRTVKAFSQEQREIQTYADRMQHVLELATKESLARGIFYGMTGLSGNAIILSVLYYGGVMVSDANITVGHLSSFLLYAAYIGVSLGGLSSFYSELNRGLGASTRLWDIIDRQPAIPCKGGLVLAEPPKGEVRFEQVRFSYPARPDCPILHDLHLTIPSGKVTAVVGASGSGKSTLAALLLRLYDPQHGSVTLDGVPVSSYDPVWLRSHIGSVSQEPVLFSGSIRDNIVYGAEHPENVSDTQVELAAKEANAHTFITKEFPAGFDTIVGERGVMLSGGQKQRVAIARALIKNPRILLLDEATSALDAESEHLVQEALERIMKGRTVLTIAHRLSTIKNADQIAVLSGGRVVEIGTYEELMAECEGAFNKLVRHQTFQS